MKKRFFYLFPLFILLLSVVCSCKDDNNEPTPPEPSPEITIPSSENLRPVLNQEGGTVSISFTATADWTASLINTRAESWITVTPNSGSKGKNEITITTTANETYDERNATVVLKCGTVGKNIVVTQKQKDALTVTSSKYEVDSKGGNISVEVKANINFEVEVKADWIKQVKSSNTRALVTSNLNFTIEPNETGDKREGEIIIKSGELSETIKVYQGYEDFITLTKKDFTIPEEGGNVDVEIKSTLNYEVKMLSDVDWITEIQSRAVSTHTHHYTVSPNDTYDSRETKIVFYNPKDENVADTVSIYQMYKGAILVARNEYQFGIDGGTLDLTVQTNLEFNVEVSDTWIQQIQPTRALSEYNLSFAISENTEQKDREGTITVKDKNSDKKQTIIVKQSYVDLEREALIALYKATNGDNWTNNTNWCSDKPISEWYGITANEGLVQVISLENNNLVGHLPGEIGKLTDLAGIFLGTNNLTGTIPEEFWNLKKMHILDLSQNNLTGFIPKEIENLSNLEWFKLFQNNFKGNIPEEIGHLDKLNILDFSDNKLNGNIPRSIIGLTNIETFRVYNNNLEGSIPKEFANLAKLSTLELYNNRLNGAIPTELLQCEGWRKTWYPHASIIPQQLGYTLYPENYHVSTDFSKDGEVSILQKHVKGNGIKIVLMGEMFVDTDMESGGEYEIAMQETLEAFFSVEPYKSLRNLFDVYSIKAVSKHDWESGETAFEKEKGNINIEKCMEYAQKAIDGNSLDNVHVIMPIKLGTSGSGLCNWYSNGVSISLCAYEKNALTYRETVIHEAGGHGIGLFRDEYVIDEETFTDTEGLAQSHKEGWNTNVDCISDPQKVRWAHFINDSRYANEGIGIFEGAFCKYGIYRATQYSIMGENTLTGHVVGQFNAPSRETIYKRAMKLAYGDSWTYDYEEFVKFDEPGRADWMDAINKKNTRSVQSNSKSKQYKHIPPKFFNYPAVVK